MRKKSINESGWISLVIILFIIPALFLAREAVRRENANRKLIWTEYEVKVFGPNEVTLYNTNNVEDSINIRMPDAHKMIGKYTLKIGK